MVNLIHTTIRIRWVLPALLIIFVNLLHAQVSFQTATLEGALIGPRTLFHATLFNAGPACEVSLEGEVRTTEGVSVITFQTESFRLQSGVRTIAANELIMRSFVYGSSSAGRTAQRFQRLAGGDYHYCLRLHAPQVESDDEYCDVLSVDEISFLDLVQPWNGDSIDEVRPPLTWTISGSGPTVGSADVRITLTPMTNGHGAAQALAAERPVFIVPHVTQRTMPFPIGLADLERGKCYAWQAERLDGSRVVDRSEPWSFCVKKIPETFQNKYVRIDRVQPGAIYEALDQKIFFRYDESYASMRMDCSIYGSGHVRIDPQLLDDTDKDAPEGARSVGVNLYELDLQPYGLKPGYYDLVVRNEKGRDRTLKFHIAP